jgi:thiosulfate dehydrogenase
MLTKESKGKVDKSMKTTNTLSAILTVAAFIALGVGVYTLIQFSHPSHPATKEMAINLEGHEDRIIIANRRIGFDLLDPELAPDEIKDQVMLGYNIIINTQKYASKFTGNGLACNNCHFCAGNTLGGKNGGISLVGVTNVYPRYSARSKSVITLKERLSNCFMRSMNGIAPSPNSAEMNAIVAYLSWISIEVMNIKDPPWIGLKPLESKHKPDPTKGAKVYLEHCAICHQPSGAGTQGVPALWGDKSFNDGAGMGTLPTLSSFVYNNMPYQQPVLTQEEALDVAAFVMQQKRPVFNKDLQKRGDKKETPSKTSQ